MACRRAELEGLNRRSAEESDLLVPVPDPGLPVIVRFPQALGVGWHGGLHLLVDVEVLSHTKPLHLAALRAVVGKLTLVCVGLGNHCQLRVPGLEGIS